jgi:FSR family fosmidomycin resistance protein-like MFS transporter
MSLILDKLFSAVALGHFTVDLINGQRSVLLAFLSGPLGLTNAALGFYSTFYVVMGALFQPVFGFISDRIGARWVAAGGMFWMAGFFTLGLMTPGVTGLWFLVLASLGSAAFHPAGTMQATLRGRTHYAGRETTSTSFFFFFGQAGGFLGPILAGPVLEHFGVNGLIAISLLAVPVGFNTAHQLSQIPVLKHQPAQIGAPSLLTRLRKIHITFPLVAFVLVAAFQSWTQQNMYTFLPKYLSDLGRSPATYGVIAALFTGGSALGGTLGGSLADRYGKRRVAVGSLMLSSLPLFAIAMLGWTPWLFVLVPLAGAFSGAPHSILVVSGQRIIPAGMGLASGLILGFMFSSGALGTLATGYLADAWGFSRVFLFTGGLVLVAAVLALALQVENKPESISPQPLLESK